MVELKYCNLLHVFLQQVCIFRFCLMNVVDILMDDKQENLDVSGVHITPPPVNMDLDENSSKEE